MLRDQTPKVDTNSDDEEKQRGITISIKTVVS